mgnify:CR=1 FL=1
MICLKCENEKFESKNVKVEQEFKGQSFNVVVDAHVCTGCGFHQFDDEQANMLRRVTVDTFKANNDLLTSDQVKDYREGLEMSQSQFAAYIGVGVASVKRWETYFVQDKSQDDLIRIKCDPSSAQNNALEVRWAHEHPDKHNGFRKFDLDVCKNVLSKIIEVAPSPLFFFKAVFYVDFIHFKRFGRGITGMQYSCFDYGPIPKDYDHLISYLLDKNDFSRSGQHDLKSNVKFNEALFSTDELATINHIYSIVEKEGKKYLFDKSHEEDAFKSCGYLETLNYEDAKSLKIA